MPLRALTLTAPSAWAPLLINGDGSGLDSRELAAVEAWLVFECLDSPVACEDAGFLRSHDAFVHWPWSADCQAYTFLVEEDR